mmetsp:Transcript_6383/g.6059  ORF Transcript_6383/g.6059 Transcript_6383/m.6059 type:complete len:142 (-) Transcript_6383:217-642(-)
MMSLRSILLFVAILALSQQSVFAKKCKGKECKASEDPSTAEDPSCPSRPHIIRCAGKYLDTNKNKLLERKELETAIDTLPWYGRGVLKIIGSVDKIMAKCDADGDDAIGMLTDMPKTEDSCLATCIKRKVFKAAFFPECEE